MPEAKAKIDFEEIGIGSVLKRYRLAVPLNQRDYSWTDKEVGTLLTDLTKAISADPQVEYFLGTIVSIPTSNDVLEVADGQQRLATTALLLAEIRNYLKPTEPVIADGIEPFLTEVDRKKREHVNKLILNVNDNEFFRSMINATKDSDRPKPGIHSSHEKLANAFALAGKHIKKVVATYDKRDHGDILNKWIQFLEHDAQVILVKVPTVANAYKMFETLNDRGLRTSQADLVKNYLFGQAADERQREIHTKWTRMQSTLESLEEDDITVTFLRQAMIAIRGHLREKDVYEKVQERVRGSQSAVQFLTQLESMATIYVAIFNSEHEKWNSYPDTIRRAIQTLNLLNIRSMRPLMLAVASKMSEKDAAEAFKMFISWGVRLIVASSTSRGQVEETLADAAHRVFKNEITTAAALKKDLTGSIIPADEDFQRIFELATVSKAAFARYYLRSLEMAAKDESTPWFIPNDDRQAINLEHIFPENPEKKWPQFDEETGKIYVRRIGNLALLLAKSNSEIRSSDFASKKQVYKSSPYELTRQVAKLSDWGPPEITERQKGLAKLALKAWPL